MLWKDGTEHTRHEAEPGVWIDIFSRRDNVTLTERRTGAGRMGSSKTRMLASVTPEQTAILRAAGSGLIGRLDEVVAAPPSERARIWDLIAEGVPKDWIEAFDSAA